MIGDLPCCSSVIQSVLTSISARSRRPSTVATKIAAVLSFAVVPRHKAISFGGLLYCVAKSSRVESSRAAVAYAARAFHCASVCDRCRDVTVTCGGLAYCIKRIETLRARSLARRQTIRDQPRPPIFYHASRLWQVRVTARVPVVLCRVSYP